MPFLPTGCRILQKPNYSKMLPLAQETENFEMLASSYINLVVLYGMAQDFEKSLVYYEQALQTFQLENSRLGIFYSLVNIGGLHNQMGAYDKSLSYFYRALLMMDTMQLLSEYAWLMEHFSETYQGKGQADSALKYALLHFELKDSIFEKEKLENVAALENDYLNQQRMAELEQKAALETSRRRFWYLDYQVWCSCWAAWPIFSLFEIKKGN